MQRGKSYHPADFEEKLVLRHAHHRTGRTVLSYLRRVHEGTRIFTNYSRNSRTFFFWSHLTLRKTHAQFPVKDLHRGLGRHKRKLPLIRGTIGPIRSTWAGIGELLGSILPAGDVKPAIRSGLG
jgi:hypothetical protein